jgi:hypothetical protein
MYAEKSASVQNVKCAKYCSFGNKISLLPTTVYSHLFCLDGNFLNLVQDVNSLRERVCLALGLEQ